MSNVASTIVIWQIKDKKKTDPLVKYGSLPPSSTSKKVQLDQQTVHSSNPYMFVFYQQIVNWDFTFELQAYHLLSEYLSFINPNNTL